MEVEYSVSFEAKPIYVTEEMVDLLRKAGEPSVDDLVKERLTYEADRKSDPLMPEWEDFYTYGYPLDKIFKFDPIRGEESTEVISVPTKPVTKEEVIEPVTSFNLTSDNDDEDDMQLDRRREDHTGAQPRGDGKRALWDIEIPNIIS